MQTAKRARYNSWIDRPIFARFESIADLTPDKIALDDGVFRFTYQEVQQAARHLAVRVEATVPMGRPVGIFLPNGALFPIAALACLATGRLFVPIDQNYPPERNDQIIKEAGLAAVILGRGDEIMNSPFGSIQQLDLTHSLGQTKSERIIPVGQIDGPAVVLYTSGSTGRPKGICNNQRAISQRVAQFITTCRLDSDDRFVLLSSPGTIAGIRDTFVALLSGATLYIADPYQLGTNGVLSVIRDHRITICYAVPALLRELLRLPNAKHAFSNLRVFRIGGDRVLASDITLCRASLPQSCLILKRRHSTIGYLSPMEFERQAGLA
jgi:non-ribosomal peptide synthetase component F